MTSRTVVSVQRLEPFRPDVVGLADPLAGMKDFIFCPANNLRRTATPGFSAHPALAFFLADLSVRLQMRGRT